MAPANGKRSRTKTVDRHVNVKKTPMDITIDSLDGEDEAASGSDAEIDDESIDSESMDE